MTKNNLPKTSLDAYKKVTPEMISNHHGKIIRCLQVLGTASYEQIADYIFLDKHQIGRRLSELERTNIIYKPGTKSPTKSGRQAFNYCLTGQGLPKTDNEVRYKSEEKTAAEYAGDLIKATQLSLL